MGTFTITLRVCYSKGKICSSQNFTRLKSENKPPNDDAHIFVSLNCSYQLDITVWPDLRIAKLLGLWKKKMVCIPHKSFSTSKVSLFLTTPYFMLLRAHDHTNWNSHTTLGVGEKHQPQTHCQEPSEILEKLWKTREVIHRECYWRIKLEVQLNHASGWLNLGRTVLKLLRSEQVNLVTTYPVVELPFDIFAKILVTSPFRAVLSITFATNP